MAIHFNWNDFVFNPFIGSGHGGYLQARDTGQGGHSGLVNRMRLENPNANPEPSLWAPSAYPDPSLFLISAVLAKETASAMTNQEAAEQMMSAADAAISRFVDDYCATP